MLSHFNSSLGTTLSVLFAFLLLSCEEQSSRSIQQVISEEGPELESWNIDLRVLENSKPRYHILAGYQARYQKGDSTYAILKPDSTTGERRVEITLYDESGEESGHLTADEVLYQNEDGKLTATSNVILRGKDSKVLRSENLRWDQNERKVYTSGYVTIDSPSEQLQGYDLVANEDLSNVEIRNLTGMVSLSN